MSNRLVPASPPPRESTALALTVIEAGRGERQYWRDLWKFRGLLGFLALRDVLVRYKQATMGIAWAILRPLLTMTVFTLVFHRIARLESHGAPYPIMVYAAMLPWQYVSTGLSDAAGSLVGNANLISKVYFPRMLIPIATIFVALADFAVALALLAVMMAFYHFVPDWRIVALPLFIGLGTLAAVGAGLLLSALSVEYRDFRFVTPFIVQFGLYVSPVGYQTSVVPERWRLLYSLNPMVAVIDGCRWSLLRGAEPIYAPGLALALVSSFSLITVGVWYFRRTERGFADHI